MTEFSVPIVRRHCVCAGCGAEWTQDVHASLTDTPVYCDACYARVRDRYMAEDADRHLRDLVERGIVTRGVLEHSFADSDPECEAPNAEHWQALRETGWVGTHTMLLYGPAGTGKTYAAQCVLHEQSHRRQSVAEATPHTLTTAWRNREPLWERMACAHVALLDDLDKVRSAYELSALWDLFDTRHRAHLPTIMTCNMTPRDLAHYLRRVSENNVTVADTLMSRWAPCDKREFTGTDLRRGAA